LAVEVVSPTNDFDEVLQKVSEYFAAGVGLVWVVIPSRRQVYVYHSETDLRVLPLPDQLDGEDVLPGFRFSVAELFEETETSETGGQN
jgi:Uma2 family endonuclease